MLVDAEALVRAWLDPLVDVPVVTRIPNPRPDVFVRVWRTGGAAINRVLDAPILTVQVWNAEDGAAAAALANTLRDLLLRSSRSITLVRGVDEVAGPYYDPDPDSESERYSFSVQLRVRAKS